MRRKEGGEEEEEEAGVSPPVGFLPSDLACCGAAGPEAGFGAVSGTFGARRGGPAAPPAPPHNQPLGG